MSMYITKGIFTLKSSNCDRSVDFEIISFLAISLFLGSLFLFKMKYKCQKPIIVFKYAASRTKNYK